MTGVTCRGSEQNSLMAVTLVGRRLPSLQLEKEAVLALNTSGIAIQGIDASERALTFYVAPSRAREAVRAIHDAIL